jgi:hypothetical protein
MLGISQRNPCTDVYLWVDSKRMTNAQRTWTEKMSKDSPAHNMSLRDLRDIHEYNIPFYSQADKSENWRINKDSLIWRQVDAARILACLQCDHDQIFYSDADVTNLVIDSEKVQAKIKKHGIIVSLGFIVGAYIGMENNLFGYDRERRGGFFKSLYKRTLSDTTRTERRSDSPPFNGYQTFLHQIYEFLRNKNIYRDEILFATEYSDLCRALPENSH